MRVNEIDLPISIRAFTVVDENGIPTVFVNRRYCAEREREACRHEKAHIDHDDFYALESADVIERVRHEELSSKKEEER